MAGATSSRSIPCAHWMWSSGSSPPSPQSEVPDRLPAQRLEGHGAHELLGRVGHRDAYLAAGVDQAPHHGAGLVGRDAAGDQEQYTATPPFTGRGRIRIRAQAAAHGTLRGYSFLVSSSSAAASSATASSAGAASAAASSAGASSAGASSAGATASAGGLLGGSSLGRRLLDGGGLFSGDRLGRLFCGSLGRSFLGGRFLGRRGLVHDRRFEVRLDHRLGDVEQALGGGQHGLAALLLATLLGVVVGDLALEHLRHRKRGQLALDLEVLTRADLVVQAPAFQREHADRFELVGDEVGDVPTRDVGHQRLLWRGQGADSVAAPGFGADHE